VFVLRTAIIQNLQDLQRIRPLWEELEAQPGMTMFQSYTWNATALNVFGQREAPRLVYVESDAGAALVPSVVGRRCGKVHLAGEAMFDYRTALLSGDASVLGRVWERMAEWGMTFESKALRGDDLKEAWSGLEVKFFANAPFLTSKVDADEFVRSRNRLGRFTRRFRRAGVKYRRHSGANRALVRHIYEKKAEQDVSTNLFRDPLRREFMMSIAALPETQCEIFTYETTGELVAALVTFRDGNVRRFYTTYFDQRWAKESPGQVLLFEATAESLREDLECDYMTGEYLYKNRFADGMVPLYEVTATREQLRVGAHRVKDPIAA
jgi:CelD/BcsL family acetyltransferase involved in cellulose biosynthesis